MSKLKKMKYNEVEMTSGVALVPTEADCCRCGAPGWAMVMLSSREAYGPYCHSCIRRAYQGTPIENGMLSLPDTMVYRPKWQIALELY